jgi:hypothetical protein
MPARDRNALQRDPQGITVGSDSRVWLTEEFAGKYGAIRGR